MKGENVATWVGVRNTGAVEGREGGVGTGVAGASMLPLGPQAIPASMETTVKREAQMSQ